MNSDKIYNFSTKIFGQGLVNFAITHTMGSVFTAGDSIEKAINRQSSLEKIGIHSILDYSCEIMKGVTDEKFFDDAAKEFCNAIDALAKQNLSTLKQTGIKLSALFPYEIQILLNQNEVKLENFIDRLSKNASFVTAAQIKEQLEKEGLTLEEKEVEEFFQKYFNISSPFGEIKINPLSWKLNVRAFYLEENLNQNKIIKHFVTYTPEQIESIQKSIARLKRIADKGRQNKVRVLVDAEQTYLQKNIELFTDLFQKVYNRDEPVLYSTIQCYLKNTFQKVNLQVLKSEEWGIVVGTKLVRGAYLSEERSLSLEEGESKVWDSLQETHDSYNRAVEKLFTKLGPKDELLVASHNEQSSLLVQDLLHKNPQKINNVYFAQLYGLADHVTFLLRHKGAKVYKYIPYGPTRILIPYLCRRAQEQYQTLDSLRFQDKLIWEEIIFRLRFGNKQ